MPLIVARTLDFNNATKIVNLPNGVDPQDAVTIAQLNAGIEGLAWKDSVLVSTVSNITLTAPGATIDGISMTSGDRFLARSQSAPEQNGIYIWNGAASTATRSLDTSTSAELEQAVVSVEEGTNAGVSYRQTALNFTLDSGSVTWAVFGTVAPAASETVAGIAEIATQVETDAGADDARLITPLKLATSVFAARKHSVDIGDGSATSYTVTHNLNTRNVTVVIYRNSGNYDTILTEVQRSSVNAVVILFDIAPTTNQFKVLVTA